MHRYQIDFMDKDNGVLAEIETADQLTLAEVLAHTIRLLDRPSIKKLEPVSVSYEILE